MKKRKDGRYCKQIRINGKKISFYGKTVAELNKSIVNYQERETKGQLFQDVAKRWENYYLQTAKYTTYKRCGKSAFESTLKQFGKFYIKEIIPRDIDLYLKELAAKGYAQKTVATYKSILHQILQYAVLCGNIDTNPAAEVKLPKNLPKKLRDMPSDEDIQIVDTLHDDFGFIAYFLLYTGLRISEALALNYDDIDRQSKTIIINKKLVYDGNKPILEHETKTESGTREVILLDRLAEYLPIRKKGIIFCDDKGDYYTRSLFRHRWERLQKDTGITLTPHQLRHAYATMLFEAGIDEKDAQELMGHSDIKLTRSIYTHIRQKRRLETAATLNNFHF